MRIAFISYEYPPDTAVGGIGTYTHHTARMLARRGHDVSVFCGSQHRNAVYVEDEVEVNRVQVAERSDFAEAVGAAFFAANKIRPFDIMEGPDYQAEARKAAQLVPDVARVAKLQTPTFLAAIINKTPLSHPPPPLLLGLRRHLSSLMKQRRVWRSSPAYDARSDIEYQHVISADAIHSPSVSLADIVAEKWNIDRSRIEAFPACFIPSAKLLEIPVETTTRRVTFIGRLEGRKGILDLARAVPQVLQQQPDVLFRFVGNGEWLPEPHRNMRDYLENLLGKFGDRIEFTGSIPLAQIPDMLAQSDICVFPSIWENFPNVCLEAMSAGRCIIGSSAGGMAEMLQDDAGILVPPRSPGKIARAILDLIDKDSRRFTFGERARHRVLTAYNGDTIGPLQEAAYKRAIEKKQQKPVQETAAV